jgi:hypothetical protein
MTSRQRTRLIRGWTVAVALLVFGLLSILAEFPIGMVVAWIPAFVLVVILMTGNKARERSGLPLAFGKDIRLCLKPVFSLYADASDGTETRSRQSMG